MCGLCGRLNHDRDRPVDATLLHAMMDTIEHRGPDGAGARVSGPIGLGHRRLSIIDLDTGMQPMCNEDGTVWVVFNGEIYNFRALRSELSKRGHRFKSNSDTEVIVHLYEELGDDCVARLQGMFAFALWDERRQRLLLARDRVGIKPLYFAETPTGIVFGSEIKCLLVDPEVKRQVSAQAIDRFLTYYYLPGPQTLLDGIVKLEPGHCLSVADGKLSMRRYWDLRFEPASAPRSFDSAVEELRALLSDTVRDHMISDVPVGVLLSGGVDSTAVLRYAASHAERPLHTFTMGFADGRFEDERPYARLASQRFGTIHHETTLSAGEFADLLPRYVWHMEEPVCEPPAVALFFVSQLARSASVKVLLSGEGGDEAFGGYQDYRNLLALERLKSGFGPFKGMLGAAFRGLSRAGWARGSHYAALVGPSLRDYYFSRSSSPASRFNLLKHALYRTDFAAALDGHPSDAPTRTLLDRAGGTSMLARMLYVDTKTWLPDDLLIKADKMTMATSVELRVPLLDSAVLQFAASLPDHYKVSGWRLKRVLKAAIAPFVPQEILTRKKSGFPVPYAQWLRGPMREFVNDTLFASDSFCGSCFSVAAIRELLHSHEHGEACSKEVFSLLVLELWHRQFARSGMPPRPAQPPQARQTIPLSGAGAGASRVELRMHGTRLQR
jgi:asparagine synthase (glutamine-hydrolysing)